MSGNVVASYYVGEPTRGKRGQDKHGQIRCMVWLTVSMEGKGQLRAYVVRNTGREVGRFGTFTRAEEFAKAYAEEKMRLITREALATATRAMDALNKLDLTPGIKQFDGPYSDKIPQQIEMQFVPSSALKRAMREVSENKSRRRRCSTS